MLGGQMMVEISGVILRPVTRTRQLLDFISPVLRSVVWVRLLHDHPHAKPFRQRNAGRKNDRSISDDACETHVQKMHADAGLARLALQQGRQAPPRLAKPPLQDIFFGGLLACKGGLATKTPIAEMEKVVKEPKFTVTIDLNLGTSGYTVYTSDLSEQYVDFNSSEYSAAIHAKRQNGLA